MKPESDGQQNKKQADNVMGMWIAIGVGMGVALGAAFDNIALGIPIGVGAGVAIGAAMSQKKNDADDSDEASD